MARGRNLLPICAVAEVERGGLVLLFDQWMVHKGGLAAIHPAGGTVLPKTQASRLEGGVLDSVRGILHELVRRASWNEADVG